MTRWKDGYLPPEEEIALSPGAAKILLVDSGRAVESGSCLVLEDRPDSIARGAFGIFISGRAETLSSAIDTYAPDKYRKGDGYVRGFGTSPGTLNEMARLATEKHAMLLGMSGEEAAQIPV